MHKRPSLPQALYVLKSSQHENEDIAEALTTYSKLVESGQEFVAARFVVDIVDHFNHLQENTLGQSAKK